MQKGNTYRAKTGNIKTMVTSLLNTEEKALPTLQNNYTYDQLNRIVEYKGLVNNTNAYNASYSYDRNGNLKSLQRSDNEGKFDNFTYKYNTEVRSSNGKTIKLNNQLQLVQDPQGARQGMGDLPDQEALLKELNISPGNNPTHNYIYDAIGQLIEDRTEGLRINRRVDGKVASISKGHHTTTTNYDVVIQFHYDGLGNRISKKNLKAGEATQQTYYTRDAQGNVMAVYGEGGTTTVVKDTPAELTVGEVANTETDIYARNHITSTTTIADKQTLNFTAGQSITLSPGFEAKQGSNATLKIGDVPATTSKEGEEVAGVFLKEHHIYGSSRLGILAHDKLIIAENPEATNEPTGKKNYVLTNHLGNVLSVISDERNGQRPVTTVYVRDAAGTPMAIYRNGTLVEHTVYGASRLGVYKRQNAKTSYEITDHLGNVRAVVEKDDSTIKGTDYYPFGMPMPLRNSLSDYRYAYQGQEKDPETGKEAFELRLWDARIGRWLTTDPARQFASPYLGMGNDPINGIDPDGGYVIIIGGDATIKQYLNRILLTPIGREVLSEYINNPHKHLHIGFGPSTKLDNGKKTNINAITLKSEAFKNIVRPKTIQETNISRETISHYFTNVSGNPGLLKGDNRFILLNAFTDNTIDRQIQSLFHEITAHNYIEDLLGSNNAQELDHLIFSHHPKGHEIPNDVGASILTHFLDQFRNQFNFINTSSFKTSPTKHGGEKIVPRFF